MAGAIAKYRQNFSSAFIVLLALWSLAWYFDARPWQQPRPHSTALAELRGEQVRQSVSAPAAGPMKRGGVMGGVIGGVPGGVPAGFLGGVRQLNDELRIVRTADFQLQTARPAEMVEKLAELAAQHAGTIQNSAVTGTERSQWAQVTMQVPVAHFDEVRRQVRQLATSVQKESTDSRDVSRTLTDEDAKLRNLRAEESQYLAIIKRASRVKDIVAVTEKLSEVRGEIERLEAERRYLSGQVEMAAIAITIGTVAEAEVLGLHWRPRYQARLAVLSTLSGLTDYADAMVQLLVHLPLLAVWILTAMLLGRVGWAVLRFLARRFFVGKPQAAVAQS
jgi:hypothetical protein